MYYENIDSYTENRKLRKDKIHDILFLCPKCNQVYTIYSDCSNHHIVEFFPEIPRYGQRKRTCPECSNNKKYKRNVTW